MLLKPLIMIAFFAGIVIPIELLLQRLIPECSLKKILFDRTLRDRKPEVFWIAVIIGYGLIAAVVYFGYSW